MAEAMARERVLRTGANIAGGIGGAIGYLAGGDIGSDIGALVDNALELGGPTVKYIKDKVAKTRSPGAAPTTNRSKEASDKKDVTPKKSEPQRQEPNYDPETARGIKRARLDYNSREGGSFEKYAMDAIRKGAKQEWGNYFAEQEYLGGYYGRNVIPEAVVWSSSVQGEVDIIIDAKFGRLTDAQTKVYIDYLAIRGPKSEPGRLVFLIPEGAPPSVSKGVQEYLKGKPVVLEWHTIPGWTAEYPLKEKR